MAGSREFIDRLTDGRMTRRELNRWLATAGLGLAVMPVLPRAARADDLIYYTWSGYDVKEFMPGFVEKHGSTPQTPLFGDEQEALTKIQSGFQVDLAHPCNNRVSIWRDAGVIEPVDTSRLEHWGELFDSLKTLKGTVTEDGQHWFLPVDWGMTALIYRSDLITDPVDSWELLWDPKYKGKLSIGDGMADTGLIVATLLKIKDPNNMTADDLARIKKKLLEQKPLLRFYWNDETTLEQALTSGEVVASSSWNGAAATLIDQGVPVKFVSPKEGALTYCCGLVRVKGGGHDDAAYDLMNAMSSPDAGKWLIETYGYGHSNSKAFGMVAPEMLAKRSLPKDPTEMLGQGVYSTVSRHLAELSQILEEVKASQ
ncbi:spermidine/putrescine ABC transporter [Hypericibacter terrae]|uniref:Spermidine/putrescine ABC transporter n=1 Tax=Hypericibacter terrae TaxID=2602015 RepID=A0A5J6MIW9_9PROT|nr:extracellular solute-binding protein [Hypericibacter terrae]QEX17343.1 spermidine/putrescine ABC transporter [Hypericibacter terrae]